MPAADRELLLSLYCRAFARTGSPAPSVAAAEAEALLTDRGQLGDHVTPEEVAAGRTHARTGALPPGRRPADTR
ncbi:hypothetical protein ACFWG0_20155 [Streptomyces yangpuensis]|uniref:hypothetical protein n=1 Tax=Streptomyces yangpuensis TaxID=1648182 RepID=UPI0036622554